MKKIILTLALALASVSSYAQFSTSGNPTTTMDNVGIGTTSLPSNGKLQVNGQVDVISVNSGGAFRIYDGTNFAGGVGTDSWATNGSNLDFAVYAPNNLYLDAGGQKRMTILSNGNVGLGTTSPLSGGSAASWLTLNGTSGYSGGSIYSIGGVVKGYSYVDNDGLLTQQAVTGQKFVTNNGITAMSIATSGNVGIGTTSPTVALDVFNATAIVRAISSTGTNRTFFAAENTGGTYYFGGENSAGNGIFGTGGLPYALGINTSSTNPLQLGTNNMVRMTISSGGNVGIGTTDAQGYKLAVNGSAIAESITVKLHGSWPDYVFKSKYTLPSLTQVKTYIDKNKHLPDMPSEQEVAKNGINLGEIVKVQTKKIEELTLYLLEEHTKNTKQEARIATLEAALLKLAKDNNK